MNGAANGAEPGFKALFNTLSDLMRRNQVIDIHHHVHINEDLLAQDPSAGDVMAIEDSRYTQRLFVDGFRVQSQCDPQARAGCRAKPASRHESEARQGAWQARRQAS